MVLLDHPAFDAIVEPAKVGDLRRMAGVPWASVVNFGQAIVTFGQSRIRLTQTGGSLNVSSGSVVAKEGDVDVVVSEVMVDFANNRKCDRVG